MVDIIAVKNKVLKLKEKKMILESSQLQEYQEYKEIQKTNELKCNQCEKELETEICLEEHNNCKHGGRKSETVNLEYENEKLKK